MGDEPQRSSSTSIAMLRRGVVLALVWAILTRADPEGMLLGVAVIPVAVWLSLALSPPGPPLRLWPLAIMLPGFVWRAIRGGIDVGWRAFHPALPINPGWQEVPVSLPGGAAAALGTELSLMPGTLAAGRDQNRLLIHVLDREQDIRTAVRVEEAQFALITGQALLREDDAE